MKYRLKPFTPCFFILLLCSSCIKDKPDITKLWDKPDVLPEATAEGRGTLGCLVNGEVWLPYDIFHESRSCYYSKGTFSINANRRRGKSSSVSVLIGKRVNGPGRYDIYETPVSYDEAEYYLYNDSNIYIPAFRPAGFINIVKLDTINEIASGTFSFTMINAKNNLDTIRVRDGRFDLRY